MTASFRLAAVLFALSSCLVDSSSDDEVASVQQPLGTAWLLELENAPAGFVSSVASATGGSLCATKSLRLSLGVNMSKAARGWLNGRLGGPPHALSGAVYLAATNQRLAFTKADVLAIELPRSKAGDASQTFFIVTTSSASQASCSAVSSAVMAQKAQLAATFAARSALAKNVEVRPGLTPLLPTPETVSSIKPAPARATVGISLGQGMQEWVKSAFEQAYESRSGAFSAAGFYTVPHDALGTPIVVVAYGPLVTVTDAGVLEFGGASLRTIGADGGLE